MLNIGNILKKKQVKRDSEGFKCFAEFAENVPSPFILCQNLFYFIHVNKTRVENI